MGVCAVGEVEGKGEGRGEGRVYYVIKCEGENMLI